MDPNIILSLSEWSVINKLEKMFPKTEGYTVSIPSKRFQKGFDIILYNRFSKLAKTIQVKASRMHVPESPIKISQDIQVKYNTFFSAFPVDKNNQADYYIFIGTFIKIPKNVASTKVKNYKWFDFIFILLEYEEMRYFLKNLKYKKSIGKENKFGFGFNNKEKVYLTRGAKRIEEFTKNLLENKVNGIKEVLNPENKKEINKRNKTISQ